MESGGGGRVEDKGKMYHEQVMAQMINGCELARAALETGIWNNGVGKEET